MQPDRPDGLAKPHRFPDLARLRFELEAQDPIELPEYPGSAWRGLLGHGLRRTACVTRQPSCAGCLLIHGCVYSLIFETPPPPGQEASGFTAMPHPYVLDIEPDSPRRRAAGEPLRLGIALFGPAIGQAPYLIHALNGAGQQGLGRERGRFRLSAVGRETAPGTDRWEPVYDSAVCAYRPRPTHPLCPPDAPERVRLHLCTPLRMQRNGHFVDPRGFRLPDLLRHLYNRLQRLTQLYGGRPETFEWSAAAALAGDLQLETADLRWHDWTRYSARQDTLMQLGGLLGELTLSGPALPQVWPALWAGQWTHVGKGTAFGLGAYRVAPVG